MWVLLSENKHSLKNAVMASVCRVCVVTARAPPDPGPLPARGAVAAPFQPMPAPTQAALEQLPWAETASVSLPLPFSGLGTESEGSEGLCLLPRDCRWSHSPAARLPCDTQDPHGPVPARLSDLTQPLEQDQAAARRGRGSAHGLAEPAQGAASQKLKT